MSRVWRLTALLLISLACRAPDLSAATLFDPALRFRVIATEHFIIYFHQGEEHLAGRLANIAESTWATLVRTFERLPPPVTHVVLVDQWDTANGYATPLPRNTVVIAASWPAGADFIGNVDDWLRLVFVHEFTHIAHLDRSEGWARAVRTVLGRTAIAFPNLYLPTWQIEGLATYEESALTGVGRLHAGDFAAVVGEEVRQRAVQPLDRLNGGLTDWPTGLGPYAYGVRFHQYLADRFGPASLGRLSTATAGRVPYFAAGAFKRVFSASLGTLWADFEATLRTASRGGATSDAQIVRLTHHGFAASGPRFDPFVPNSIVYSARTPHGFPALNRVQADGSRPERITTRYLGDTATLSADTIYFDQQEIRRNVGLYSDLYAWSRSDGRVTRLTSEARLLDPDLSPDGTTIVCVQQKLGRRDLVLVRLTASAEASADKKPDATYDTTAAATDAYVARTGAITTLISEPDTQFNAPRWSPDGRTIAVELHRPTAGTAASDVVLIDVASMNMRILPWTGPVRMVTPTWRRDGGAVVVAVAAGEEPFNLYEFNLDGVSPPRQLTRTTGGATWPDVSPDGHTIVFVGYTVDGFDLFTMPYPADTDVADTASGARAGLDALPREMLARRIDPLSSMVSSAPRYSPFRTLRPMSWSPVYESDSDQVRLGASVAEYDVLGYHFYAATATWLLSGPADAPKPDAGVPDWNLYYSYGRWRPVLWATAESSTSFFAGPATAEGEPLPVTLRERQIEGGLLFPILHARRSHQALVSVLGSVDEFTMADDTLTRDRVALRGALSTATARTYGYSISPERGIRAGGTVEAVRKALGSSADATILTADIRAYAPMPAAHHVLAIRLAGGASSGDVNLRRTFLLGGAGPNLSVISFGRDAFSLMRGFPTNQFAGTHVALLNADYRFPIVRPQRGAGTWPLFLHTVHASAFGDVGQVWTNSRSATGMKMSVGGELSMNLVAGFFFPMTATAGAAWGHDARGETRNRATYYFRVGRAF